MDTEFIARRLYLFANWYAASRTFRFGDGAESLIGNMTRESAERIYRHGVQPLRLQAEVKTAEALLTVYVDAMIEYWRQTPELQTRGNIIGERTFEWARNLLCPLPPIC